MKLLPNHPDRPTPSRAPARRRRRAFSLIEILIVVVILGILAAIVFPQFSNASLTARENTLKDDLRYLRTQLVVYKAQHKDVPPGYPPATPAGSASEANFIAQLTQASNDTGATNPALSAAFPLGPYLAKMPPNPINGLSTVRVLQRTDPLPTAAAGTHGWIYHPAGPTIYCDAAGNDANGNAYFDY